MGLVELSSFRSETCKDNSTLNLGSVSFLPLRATSATINRKNDARILEDVARIRLKVERNVRSTQCNRMLQFNIIIPQFRPGNIPSINSTIKYR
jgi:hypothetical protein